MGPRACALQPEKPLQSEARAPQPEAPAKQPRPSAVIDRQVIKAEKQHCDVKRQISGRGYQEQPKTRI